MKALHIFNRTACLSCDIFVCFVILKDPLFVFWIGNQGKKTFGSDPIFRIETEFLLSGLQYSHQTRTDLEETLVFYETTYKTYLPYLS